MTEPQRVTTHPLHVKKAWVPKSFSIMLQALVEIKVMDEWAGCVNHKLLVLH